MNIYINIYCITLRAIIWWWWRIKGEYNNIFVVQFRARSSWLRCLGCSLCFQTFSLNHISSKRGYISSCASHCANILYISCSMMMINDVNDVKSHRTYRKEVDSHLPLLLYIKWQSKSIHLWLDVCTAIQNAFFICNIYTGHESVHNNHIEVINTSYRITSI